MSSSSTKLVPSASSVSPFSRLLTPKTPAITRIETPTARLYGSTHVPLVLAYYVFRFKALVADPLSTTIWDIVPLTLLQCVFCTVCLPSAGTWGSGGKCYHTRNCQWEVRKDWLWLSHWQQQTESGQGWNRRTVNCTCICSSLVEEQSRGAHAVLFIAFDL